MKPLNEFLNEKKDNEQEEIIVLKNDVSYSITYHANTGDRWEIKEIFRAPKGERWKKSSLNTYKKEVKEFGIKNKSLNESKIPNFKNAWDIIEFLDNIPELKKFRNNTAKYDDTYFDIPVKDWNKYVGWSEKEVEEIDDDLEPYEGSIDHQGNKVYVIGGA